MKNVLKTFPVLLLAGLSLTLSAVPFSHLPRPLKTSNLYVPFGFDNNDLVEVVVEGGLPTICHKAPQAKVTQEGNDITIEMTSFAPHGSEECLRMYIPFLQPVSLGVLKEGTYTIHISEKLGPKTYTLHINKSSKPTQDDYIYAMLDDMTIDEELGTVEIKGHHPNECYVFDRIDVYDNGVDTYSVLPILRKVRSECPKKLIPFTEMLTLPNNLDRDKVLLHARGLGGKSLNALFKVIRPSFEHE